MMKIFKILILLSYLSCSMFTAMGQDNARFVDPFIGTDKSDVFTKWGHEGGVYPGAVSPWGMAQLTPETGRGYLYSENRLSYFSCLGHHSGYPGGSAGGLHIMFYDEEANKQTFRPLNHDREEAKAGYYSYVFDEGDKIEATTTTRVGLFRYTPASESSYIIIRQKDIKFIDKQTIEMPSYRAKIYFNRPFSSYDSTSENIIKIKFEEKSQILVKVALSAVDTEGAEKNMVAEMPEWDFEKARKENYNAWNNELSVIDVSGGSDADKQKFYTALYHSMLIPAINSDANQDDFYTMCSTWDTFRSLHPLLNIIKRKRQSDILNSWLDIYEKRKRLPIGPMTGYHTIQVYLDSYVKGINNFDKEKAYEAILKLWENSDNWLQSYKKYGYVNDSIANGVNITLDLAYNDWAFSKLIDATGTGNEKVENLHKKRSFNFVNIFDTQTSFMLPRHTGGFVRGMGERGYKEADKWTATWFVPHDIQSLVNLMGGDSLFIEHLSNGYKQGHMIHDNEPVLHYPYLYSYAGAAWKTSEQVAVILKNNYRTTPGGIPGNDDLGSMSSWYVLSAMGIFPVTPGTDQYVINTPLFDKIVIKQENGKEFVINADGDYYNMPYFSDVSLNEKAIKRLYITHSEIESGGELNFKRTEKKPLHLSDYARPYSASKPSTDFDIIDASLRYKKATPNELNTLYFDVKNNGSVSSYLAEIVSDNKVIAKKLIKINSGETTKDSLNFRLYNSGKNIVNFGDNSFSVKISKSSKQAVGIVCDTIIGDEIYEYGLTPRINVVLKNVSSYPEKGKCLIKTNDDNTNYIAYDLLPGEVKVYEKLIPVSKEVTTIDVLEKQKKIKSYKDAIKSSVLDIDFDSGKAIDNSGFNNVIEFGAGAEIISTPSGNVLKLSNKGFLNIKQSESLNTKGLTLTMMLWMKPSTRERYSYVDFFTKGDYNTLKMFNKYTLGFFAGGWGRGTVMVKLDDSWYDNWHHVVAVCDGTMLKLYIDGKLMNETPIVGEMLSTEVPWNIGRNAEMPFERNYEGLMDKIKIFSGALSNEDIMKIYKEEQNKYKF